MKQILLILCLLGGAPYLSAQNFTVTSVNDVIDANPGDGNCDDGTGTCTLRAAIMESNALTGAHTITVPAGTYDLTIAGAQEDGAISGDLDLTADITIVGAAAQTTIINADSLDRVFHVLPNSTSSITLVTIQEGYVIPGNGGGILNEGELTVTYSIIENNFAGLDNGGTESKGFGGGIANEGTLIMTNSTIAANAAKGGRGSNGLNGGGGGGSTPGFGGGIYNGTNGIATLENLTVSGNRASGGRHSSGSVNAGNWNFAGQNGGGEFFGIGGTAGGGTGGNGGDLSGGGGGGSEPFGGGLGGNGGFGAGGGGGGASAGGGNGGNGGSGDNGGGPGGQPCCSYGGGGGAGAGMGGGIFNNGGTITMNSSTIAFNESFGGSGAAGWGGWAWGGGSGFAYGGGLYNRTGTFEINNTIISNNLLHDAVLDNNAAGTTSDNDLKGTFTSTNGHNLVLTQGAGILNGTTNGNVLNADPNLGVLAFNGGETSTHEIVPCPASPAINAADGSSAALLDQRDYPRVGVPDIGAFEGVSANIDLAAVTVSPCVGTTDGEITVTASTGTAPYIYQWDAAAGNQTTSTATGLIAGTYTVTITDDNNCVKDTTITITALSSPIIDLGNDTTLCDGSTMILDAENTGSSYLWQDNSTNQTLTVDMAGQYSVEVTDGTTNCVGNDTIEVLMEQQPDAGADNFIDVCNSGAPIDMNSLLAAGITGGIWTETSVNPSQTMDVTTGVLTMNQSLSGTYTFNYSMSGVFCPSDSSEMTVNVSIQPDAGTDNNLSVCSTDGAVDLNGILSTGASPGAWTESSTTPSGQFNETNGIFDPSDLSTSSYTFTYTTDVVTPCPVTTSTMTISVIATPVSNFDVSPIEGCDPLDVNLANLSTMDAGTNCFWDLGDGTTSNDCNLSFHTYYGAGCYDITLTLDNQGCAVSSTQSSAVCVNPNPVANFDWPGSQIFSDDPTVMFHNQSIGASTNQWSFGDGNFSSEENPTHEYEVGVAGEYDIQLIVTSDKGCMDSITKSVTINEILLFFVPNSFTPDGDEHNNTFGPVMTQGFDPFDYSFLIFNRWGELIFESNDHEHGWDGSFNGVLVQDGMYTWKLEFGDINNDERYVTTGHVTMIR